ncbi:MAG: metal-dependent transcriptional regulator [Candidatus Riflebacteria bacterium]|nr:metal-dependent transcriptional regulator [Candidatus Riflebacteria bacterium]
MNNRDVDEVLEALWMCSEKKDHHLATLRGFCDIPVDEAHLATMEHDGLITIRGEMLFLTDPGRDRAASVIRRHRLAERLLVDILNVPIQQIEAGACEFEHILATQVVDSICTLLGHPLECPHGAPIPRGDCCAESKAVVDSLVVPLTRLEVGASARIAFVSTSRHPRMHKLMSFGLTPGVTVKVHQRSPAYVVSCGQAELALEEDVAADIHVWKSE